MAARNMFW